MLMSKAEYARHRGVSRQTVYEWIEKGEVVLSGRKVDVEATEKGRSPRRVNGSGTSMASNGNAETTQMTWAAIADNIRLLDGVASPANTLDELVQRVYDAASLFNLEVREPSPEFVIYELYDSEQDVTAFTSESGIAEIEVLNFLRWVALTGMKGDANFDPLEEIAVTKRALAALSEPFTNRAKEIYEPIT